MSAIQRAMILGGGIGGLCTAIALRQVGVEATVHEKAAVLGDVGAGLTLWPNAIRVLRKLGAAEQAIATGSVIERGQVRTTAGKVLSRSNPGELQQLLGEPTLAIHRADLHAILLSLLPADGVKLGMTGVTFTPEADGVTVRFEDGHTDQADLLIGADGLHSLVRRQVFPAAQLRYAGYPAWRGVVEAPDTVKVGITSETWGRGSRFGVVPIDARRVYWFAALNEPPGRSYLPDEQKKMLQQRFTSWPAPIEKLLAVTPAEAILHHDLYDIAPLPRWSAGRVTLLGDAAHPTTPNMGQGACMAIESAWVLARCLSTTSDVAAALEKYERVRRPRTAWITTQSWQIGRVGQLENGLLCRLRDTVLALTPDSVMKGQSPLIIIDDLWKADDRLDFKVPGISARYLITTQRSNLLSSTIADLKEVPPLEPDAGKSLFCNILNEAHLGVDEALINTAVARSGGSPLAIVTMAEIINDHGWEVFLPKMKQFKLGILEAAPLTSDVHQQKLVTSLFKIRWQLLENKTAWENLTKLALYAKPKKNDLPQHISLDMAMKALGEDATDTEISLKLLVDRSMLRRLSPPSIFIVYKFQKNVIENILTDNTHCCI